MSLFGGVEKLTKKFNQGKRSRLEEHYCYFSLYKRKGGGGSMSYPTVFIGQGALRESRVYEKKGGGYRLSRPCCCCLSEWGEKEKGPKDLAFILAPPRTDATERKIHSGKKLADYSFYTTPKGGGEKVSFFCCAAQLGKTDIWERGRKGGWVRFLTTCLGSLPSFQWIERESSHRKGEE